MKYKDVKRCHNCGYELRDYPSKCNTCGACVSMGIVCSCGANKKKKTK